MEVPASLLGLMVHFPGVFWPEKVWDTPYDLWDAMCEVVKVRNRPPQRGVSRG